ncbi:MAG TPA: hypothetical protein VFX50_19120 [Gemmatimonadales bacterium]|nr:hypothetical protein [Gemmatimonadales bacterium]
MLAALLAALVALAAAAAPAAAQSNIVLPRSGQVGLGLQGQFGTLLSSGGLGEEFGSGGGLVVKVRYRMRFERAMGLTFDLQKLGARDPSGRAGAFDSLEVIPGQPVALRERLQINTAGIEFYQLFDTRSRTVKFISAGAGLALISSHLSTGETQYPTAGDGVFVSLGAGIERFFFRSVAWDMSVKYMGILHDQKLNHDFQLQGGLIFYAAY